LHVDLCFSALLHSFTSSNSFLVEVFRFSVYKIMSSAISDNLISSFFNLDAFYFFLLPDCSSENFYFFLKYWIKSATNPLGPAAFFLGRILSTKCIS
jgi:hypothetical protein